jgi:hypothetical protein
MGENLSNNNNDSITKLDSGLKKCGSVVSKITIICCIILITIFVGIGYTSIRKSDDNDIRIVDAIVTSVSNCQTHTTYSRRRSTTTTTTCNLNIKYTVDNKDYSANITTNDNTRTVNEIIKISYNIKTPQTPIYNYVSPKKTGKMLIGIGILFTIFTLLLIVLHKKSDWYKRIMCISGISSIVPDIF